MTSPWPRRAGDLLLREATEADLGRLQTIRNRPENNEFTVRTHVAPDALRSEWLARRTPRTDFSCLAERDGAVVAIGFLDVVDGPGQPGVPAGTDGLIGYMVDPEHRGRGVATAVASGLLAAAFEDLELRRVTATCFADNPASARVLERAGMRREGRFVQDCWHAERGWIDSLRFALLRTEWPPAP